MAQSPSIDAGALQGRSHSFPRRHNAILGYLFPNYRTSLITLSNVSIIAFVATKTEMKWAFSTGNLVIALILYAAVVSSIAMLSRRILLSLTSASVLMVTICIASKIKFGFLNENLVANDLRLLTPSQIAYFGQREPTLSAILFASLGIGIAAFIAGWRSEVPRVRRRDSLIMMALSISSVTSIISLREEDLALNLVDNYHMTSFFRSIPRIPVYLEGAELPYQHLSSHKQPMAENAASASPSLGQDAGGYPDIIVILHESTVDPERFKKGPAYAVDRDFFRSSDGTQRQLIVETFGGATWISEYGLLLGISTHHFGQIRTNLGSLLEGPRIGALPYYLKSKGYSTTALYAANINFANTKNFYQSIGFDKVYDDQDLKFDSDSSIYSFLLRKIRDARANGKRGPAFYFVITAATHFPYNFTILPARRTTEIRSDDDWAEYSRRLRIGADDFRTLEARLGEEFKGDRFLVVGFGDHQPFITRPFYSNPGAQADVRSNAMYESFYRANGVNYVPRLDDIPQRLEIGLLGTSILKMAGLPLDQGFAPRAALLRQCGGLIVRCADQKAVLDFNASIVDRGELPGIAYGELSCSDLRRRGLPCLKTRGQ